MVGTRKGLVEAPGPWLSPISTHPNPSQQREKKTRQSQSHPQVDLNLSQRVLFSGLGCKILGSFNAFSPFSLVFSNCLLSSSLAVVVSNDSLSLLSYTFKERTTYLHNYLWILKPWHFDEGDLIITVKETKDSKAFSKTVLEQNRGVIV